MSTNYNGVLPFLSLAIACMNVPNQIVHVCAVIVCACIHTHARHVRTQVVKEVPVDRVVEVIVEKMIYNEVEVPVERIVTKEVLVEVERQVPVDRVVEVRKKEVDGVGVGVQR